MLTKISKALQRKGFNGCAYGFKSRHSDHRHDPECTGIRDFRLLPF